MIGHMASTQARVPGFESRRPTLEDVARLAGVSRATVSRVVRGEGPVSATTRAAVRRAVAEVGYVPDEAARSLARGPSRPHPTRGATSNRLSDGAATTPFEAHFDRMAADYAGARPPYPPGVYEALRHSGVIGEGVRVLEVGAGAGLATRELVAAGCEVVALEPGERLARLLRQEVPAARVLVAPLEDSVLEDGGFDSVVAATALHWVDLDRGLPLMHAALRPGGLLGVWRTIFGDESRPTPFRAKVAAIVAARGVAVPRRPDDNPSMEQLAAGGWFSPVSTRWWEWSIDLTSEQVRRLFATFSDWSTDEVAAATRAVDELGGKVTEHYRSALHVLRRADSQPPAIPSGGAS